MKQKPQRKSYVFSAKVLKIMVLAVGGGVFVRSCDLCGTPAGGSAC